MDGVPVTSKELADEVYALAHRPIRENKNVEYLQLASSITQAVLSAQKTLTKPLEDRAAALNNQLKAAVDNSADDTQLSVRKTTRGGAKHNRANSSDVILEQRQPKRQKPDIQASHEGMDSASGFEDTGIRIIEDAPSLYAAVARPIVLAELLDDLPDDESLNFQHITDEINLRWAGMGSPLREVSRASLAWVFSQGLVG